MYCWVNPRQGGSLLPDQRHSGRRLPWRGIRGICCGAGPTCAWLLMRRHRVRSSVFRGRTCFRRSRRVWFHRTTSETIPGDIFMGKAAWRRAGPMSGQSSITPLINRAGAGCGLSAGSELQNTEEWQQDVENGLSSLYGENALATQIRPRTRRRASQLSLINTKPARRTTPLS
jgi:hypothetical protein